VKTALKIIGICLALVLLAGVMAYLAGFFETKIPVDYQGVVPSATEGSVYTVEVTTEPLIERSAGTVRAKVETVISPVVTATVSSIAVRSGDQVRQGDVLVRLDSRELKARAAQAHQAVIAAKATRERVEKDYKRVQRIHQVDAGAISKADLDRAQAAVSTTRAQLLRAQRREDEARTALSYSTLTAPIDGRVVERYADPGDTARQGEPLLRMYDPGSLRLEASVRESVASKLAKDQQVAVLIDALEEEFAGSVDEIVPSADPGSRSFLVKVSLSINAGLYPGMFGRLLIPIGQIDRIYTPSNAVTRVGQLDFVMVKTAEGVVRRYVRIGRPGSAGRVEVISGLSAGEQILITEP
jgi:RND family efflux transporter MFP subunit